MGNSAGKEQRPVPDRLRSADARGTPDNDSDPSSPGEQVYNVRSGRGSFLGMGNSSDRDTPRLEPRKEIKQEREARKAEKERVLRETERERSMREEHVDGGYLVTQGVYTGTEDYNKGVVRQLMIERRIAPFWRGLNDHSTSWTEHQLVAVARGKPVPAPDEMPIEDEASAVARTKSEALSSETNLGTLTVPISSRSHSFNSETSSNISPIQSSFPTGASNFPPPTNSLGSALSRGRAKTLASLTPTSKNAQADMTPKEINLSKDPYIAGQPVEAYLYKDATECPICFLYYPPYLNKTRCCDQAICSECFVQIKRPAPHPPEHADPSVPHPSTENADHDGPDDELVSEPAACPFCVQPEFGITYDSPPFRRGLAYVNHPSGHPLTNPTSAMSSSSSLGSAMSIDSRLSPTRRRTISVSATSPTVITTDKVRPDWHQKLSAARAHTARRSAAATALHTAAYLMGNRGQEFDGRTFGALGRRGILRRTSGADSTATGSSQLNMLALMSERYAVSSRGDMGVNGGGDPSIVPLARGSSRHDRVEDMENMMLAEAIRLSLASEEERQKREDKEAKKEAKKKEKENKKADKRAKKMGIYPSSANQSSAAFGSSESECSAMDDTEPSSGKGKAAQHATLYENLENPGQTSAAKDPQTHLERARAQILPSDPTSISPYASIPYRPSHLRTLSNASSSASSTDAATLVDNTHDFREPGTSTQVSPHGSGINIASGGSSQETYISGTPPGGGAGMEPIFSFRSLAAMVGEDEKAESTSHIEHSEKKRFYGLQRGESSNGMDVQSVQEGIGSLPVQDESSSRLRKELHPAVRTGEAGFRGFP